MISAIFSGADGEALAEVLALAVVTALSPVPIVAVILILTSERARSNGVAFVAGWIVGTTVIGAAVLLLTDAKGDQTGVGLGVVLQLTLGALLILAALQQWLTRPRDGARPVAPVWMRAIDRLAPSRAGLLGVLLSAVYPKTVLLVASGAAAIAEASADAGTEAGLLAGFLLIGACGVAAPVAIHLATGERSERALRRLRAWIGRNSGVALPVLFSLIGSALVADALNRIL